MHITRSFRQANLKSTHTRRQIYQVLASHHLLTADDIVAILEDQGHSVDRVTVYRNLELFLQHKLVCTHHFGQSAAQFELRQRHHDHAVCTQCGQIQAIDCRIDPPTIPNFSIDHHHINLYGTCRSCQKGLNP